MLEETFEVLADIITNLEEEKMYWLYKAGSANVQTRGGYIEAMNKAIEIVSEYRKDG